MAARWELSVKGRSALQLEGVLGLSAQYAHERTPGVFSHMYESAGGGGSRVLISEYYSNPEKHKCHFSFVSYTPIRRQCLPNDFFPPAPKHITL